MNRTASRATGQPSQEKIIGPYYGGRPEGYLQTSGSDMHPITFVMAYHTPQFIESNSLSGDVAADEAGVAAGGAAADAVQLDRDAAPPTRSMASVRRNQLFPVSLSSLSILRSGTVIRVPAQPVIVRLQLCPFSAVISVTASECSAVGVYPQNYTAASRVDRSTPSCELVSGAVSNHGLWRTVVPGYTAAGCV